MLDTAGSEVAKKQFGISGDKDIISEIILGSENLYMLGQLTGATYLINSNPSMFFYKTKADFSD